MENIITAKNIEVYKSAYESLRKEKYKYALKLFTKEKTGNFQHEPKFSQINEEDTLSKKIVEDIRKIYQENKPAETQKEAI